MTRTSILVLVLAASLALAGCTAMLPSSSAVSPSRFKSFEEAQAAFDKTVPYQTTVDDLKALGLDPHDTANVTVIPYPEIIARLAPYSGVALDALDPGVRDCILAQTQCKAYVFRFGRTDRQRDGNFFLDFLNIKRHTQVSGWRFEGLVVVRNGVVLFRNSAGEPKLDATERNTNPLGPFQRYGESSDIFLR